MRVIKTFTDLSKVLLPLGTIIVTLILLQNVRGTQASGSDPVGASAVGLVILLSGLDLFFILKKLAHFLMYFLNLKNECKQSFLNTMCLDEPFKMSKAVFKIEEGYHHFTQEVLRMIYSPQMSDHPHPQL